jgi:hypothetical protein
MMNSGCACELALSTNLGHGGRYDQFEVICFFTLKFTLATKRSARQCSNLDSGGLFLCVVASGLPQRGTYLGSSVFHVLLQSRHMSRDT